MQGDSDNRDDTDDSYVCVSGHPADDREVIDASLGTSVAADDRDRLLYIEDMIAELRTMAEGIELGMLARILSLAQAETERLVEVSQLARRPKRMTS